MVEYLKAKNRILRDKLPDRITVTPGEPHRLVQLGAKLGPAIHDLITVVTPRAFARWLAGSQNQKAAPTPTRKPGRPRTANNLRELVLRIRPRDRLGVHPHPRGTEKLGIRSVSRSTVVNILKEAGLDPGPKRGPGTWDEFLKRHAATLWACDFLSVKTWTLTGLVEVYVLLFIHIGTRTSGPGGYTSPE